MSRLDWIIKCNEQGNATCEIMCQIFQYAYDEGSYNDALQVWLSEIKPKLGRPRLRTIRTTLAERVWEDLC